VPVAAQAERLRQLPGARLQAELHATFGSCVPAGWRAAAERPQRWLHALASASLDAWGVSERRWRDAGPLLGREFRRVGIAVVRAGLDALLNSLHPRIRYAAGVLSLASAADRDVDLARRRLALLPMIAGPGAVFGCFDLPDVACLAYPLRGLDGPDAADVDALALIISAPRAAILRQLRHPRTIHELARAVHCAPNTASYHCHQLETAGLITRHRERRVVRVTRTVRGAELLDLMSG
jgi:DNA-binding MarR family transcriptional regulator